jgi:hypothetical protein
MQAALAHPDLRGRSDLRRGMTGHERRPLTEPGRIPKWSPQLEHLHGSFLRAVAELAELAAGRSDLLARFAGMEVGLHEGDLDEERVRLTVRGR